MKYSHTVHPKSSRRTEASAEVCPPATQTSPTALDGRAEVEVRRVPAGQGPDEVPAAQQVLQADLGHVLAQLHEVGQVGQLVLIGQQHQGPQRQQQQGTDQSEREGHQHQHGQPQARVDGQEDPRVVTLVAAGGRGRHAHRGTGHSGNWTGHFRHWSLWPLNRSLWPLVGLVTLATWQVTFLVTLATEQVKLVTGGTGHSRHGTGHSGHLAGHSLHWTSHSGHWCSRPGLVNFVGFLCQVSSMYALGGEIEKASYD
ncbi:hypothetical protein EGW08_014860 [Elysia chlorotica]|uniref:Uncharacterized protein n=1 Tax=Elysia chlorotica TaxID=188477 RepID=A0A433T755_ELYCH|nr:hypothetical protein EGW08_014860 [Elysia chlorotica]